MRERLIRDNIQIYRRRLCAPPSPQLCHHLTKANANRANGSCKSTCISKDHKKPTLKYLSRMSEKLDPLANQPSGTISVCSHWMTRLLSSLRSAA